jgi:hypothetical protein
MIFVSDSRSLKSNILSNQIDKNITIYLGTQILQHY